MAPVTTANRNESAGHISLSDWMSRPAQLPLFSQRKQRRFYFSAEFLKNC
ncbi:MAG: hypothetical protein Q4E13_03330 [Clostridia bacterium]|nr:hypothetical protein [Clostridia bacterium]